ncbi:MFS transporter, partial [Francisellaceae bacterium]|nr:MFS transporter [Francisellaceae bacterium]
DVGLFSKRTIKGWLFFILAGSFFLYEFFCRASMGPMENLFRVDLNINVATVGLISSAFYLAYSVMQIPVGLLVDKFGVRRMGGFAITLTAVGCLVFSMAHSVPAAWVGRFIIGIGAAFGYVLMLKIILEWFPHKHLGFMGGMTQILGMIGPLIAGVPLTLALEGTGGNWRLIFYFVVFVGVMLAILFYSVVRDGRAEPTQEIKHEKYNVFQHLKKMVRFKQLWVIAIYVFFVYASIELLGSLFGMTYLQRIGYSPVDSAAIVAFLWLGLGFGSPIIGVISDRLQRRKVVLLGCSLLGVVASTIFLWVPMDSKLITCVLFFGIGVAAGAQSLTFPAVVENITPELEGTSIGFNNMFVLLGASVIQIVGGWLITFFSSPGLNNHSEVILENSPEVIHGYQMALSITILFFAISFIFGLLFMKETGCKRVV